MCVKKNNNYIIYNLKNIKIICKLNNKNNFNIQLKK